MLKEKVIVVTGGGAGIGWGITQACAEAEAIVVIAERNLGAKEKAEALKAEGKDVSFFHLDVSKPESISAFIESVEEKNGRVDGLVNNAGDTLKGDFFEFSLEQLETLWSTNQRSTFLMSQGIARIMKENGGGSIVNISSIHSVASIAGYEMYAATKGAISAMTRAMSWSLGRYGIRANSLSPGLTKTERVEDLMDNTPELDKVFRGFHATGEYNDVRQVGDIAVFLLSQAAAAITGANLIADQGMTAELRNVEDLK